MSDIRPVDADETGAIEVCVYRDTKLIHRQLCESAEQAAAVVEAWEQDAGVECDVHDLSGGDPLGVFSEGELAEPSFEDYPEQ